MASRIRLRSLFRLVAALTALLWSAHVAADTWMPPDTETYFSPDKKVRLTITPGEDTHPTSQFLKKAGQTPSSPQPSAWGLLERKIDSKWEVVWNQPLINKIAPVNALTTKSGRYVVTFDNWYGTGRGNHVVVIYGPDGSMIRSLGLEDFLPADYIKALPRSISSVEWSGRHRISADEKNLILKVIMPAEFGARGPDRFVDVRIDLATGQPLPLRGRAWERALAQASRALATIREAEAKALAARIAPLIGPSTTEEPDWHQYLEEAFFRLDPDWEEGYPAKQILRSPTARDYEPSEKWLREELLSRPAARVISIASPASPGNLVKVLTEIGRKIEPGALKESRIYVAVEPAYHDRITTALAPTGAALILLDPAQPIPQRKERLPEPEPAD